MKKILLILVFMSGFTFGQFSVTESSNDWTKLGSSPNDVTIFQNKNFVKIQFEDMRNRTMNYDPLSTFKSPFENKINDIKTEIKKGNEGVKSGYYNFTFTNVDSSLDKLYNLILDKLKTKSKEELTLDFPEGKLYLKFSSHLGIMAVSFGTESNGNVIYSLPLAKGQINKLFGKN